MRDYKEFGEGEWYHVYSRGNGKMDLFRDDQDFRVFLDRVGMALRCQRAPLTRSSRIRIKQFDSGTFTLAAFCLMPNHFHMLIRQNTDVAISKLFLTVLTSYSKYFNNKYEHIGHLFQDRFRAVHIDSDAQLLHVSAYIHQNPKIATLVRSLSKWPHSSYPEYRSESGERICDTNVLLEHFKSPGDYIAYVEDSFDDIRARKDIRKLMLDESL